MPGDPTHHVPPEQWETALADTDGPQLFVAGPGAGKTEFLTRRARHLINSGIAHGSEVLMLTFSRRATADLRHRVSAELAPGLTAPHTATFHSLSFRILEAHAPKVLGWASMPALLTGPEQVGVIRRLLSEESPGSWPAGFSELLGTRTFAEEVTDFLLRASERLLGPADVAALAADRADWVALPSFMERVDDHYREKHRIDYAGVLSSAIKVMEDPDVRGSLAEQYRYVLVDEYQDTTDAQTLFLRLLVEDHGNLTVTADVDQSIYSFRGADLRNVDRFSDVFSDVGDVTTKTLTTSFRVPEEILTAARRLATPDLPGAPPLIEPVRPGGRVDVFVFDQQSHEAEWIAGELERLHLEEKVPYRRMAVLLRTKRRLLPELSRALERRGIPHDRPDARLIDHPAIRVINDLVDVATRRGTDLDLERAVRRLLLGPLIGLSLGAERELVRAWHRGEGSWASLVAERLPSGSALAQLLADGSWATDQPAEDGFWHAWTALPHWDRLATDPARADFRTAWSSFGQVLGHLAERDPGLSLADFMTLAGDDAFEASTLLRYAPTDDRLVLTTLHQAKGLEFDVVVIADAVDGVLPDLRRSFSLLNTNQLHPDQRGTIAASRFRIEEERRLVYTAMTRATARVVWTATAAGIEETEGRPSRFLLDITQGEIPGPPERASDRPVTGMEAEALLRRTASDPAASPADRLAAASVLADNPHPAVRPVGAFTGIHPRGSDVGLIPDDAAFSPSQATAYDACPLQYALSRHLGIGDEASVYMYQGSLVHKVAEIVDRRVLEDPTYTPTTVDALEVLDATFDPAEFGGGPWAEAWRRRAAQLVTDLFEAAPAGGAVAFVEHGLQMDLDGERWRGRADRIDHGPDGTLRVVDYKTGTSMLSAAEAAESLQLGFYVLAASADPEVAMAGEIGGAELWYPAVRQKRSIATRRFDMGRLDDVRERLIEIAAAVRREEFEPIVGGHCQHCRVRVLCDEWPEGAEAFTP